jgi:hypothetical protein
MQKSPRKKGDGTFRVLPNGSVEFVVPIENDIYGNRQRKRFYGKDEKECRKKYKSWLKDGAKLSNNSKERTLSGWIDEWLPTYKKSKGFVLIDTAIKQNGELGLPKNGNFI